MVTQVKERKPRANAAPRRAVQLPFGLKAHELVAAVAVLVFAVLTLVFYFSTLKPRQDEIASLQRQLDTLKKTEVEATRISEQPEQPFIDEAKEALESLDYFKSAHLRPQSSGRIALINDINALARKNNVQLTSGIEMQMDRAGADAEEEKDESKRRSKESFLRVFPNLDMRFTVSGGYQQLRNFINDLEANKQFKVLKAISLDTIRESEGQRGRRTSVVTGIALTIELTAYFYPEAN